MQNGLKSFRELKEEAAVRFNHWYPNMAYRIRLAKFKALPFRTRCRLLATWGRPQ